MAGESELVESFMKAYDAKNLVAMTKIIKDNKDKVPAEVRALVKEALLKGTSKDDKTAKFFMAELMARQYNNITNDPSLLIEIKKAEFDSRLHKAVASEAENGIHVIEIPLGTEKVRNVFIPDNIIIKQGETVRWKNNDKIAHIFASMPLIGNGGIFSPSLKPGATWEYRFDKPGEYFYLCFIHKGMVGKIRVLPVKKASEAGKALKTNNGGKDERAEKPSESKKEGAPESTQKPASRKDTGKTTGNERE